MHQEGKSGKNRRLKSVWIYLTILFAVALGLILYSLAMRNRDAASAVTSSLVAYHQTVSSFP